jgi:hypothetical protein
VAGGSELFEDADRGVHGRDDGPLPGRAAGCRGAVGVPDALEVVAVQPVAHRSGAVVFRCRAAAGAQVQDLSRPKAAEVRDDYQAGGG